MRGFAPIAAVVLTACFDPSYPEGGPCEDDGECPDHQECDQAEGVCVDDSSGTNIDASVGSDPDADTGSGNGNGDNGNGDGGGGGGGLGDPEWDEVTPVFSDSPPERVSTDIAYDPVNESVILFGGHCLDNERCDDGDPLGDTWEWDGVEWTDRTPDDPDASPPARSRHRIVYDRAREEIVLMGGELLDGTFVNDTWTWDGEKWTEKTPSDAPTQAVQHVMAYHGGSERVVFFNRNTTDADVVFSETWHWDGSEWTDVTPTDEATFPEESPLPRTGSEMTYDAARDRVVLYGGRCDCDEDDHDEDDATWEWDGQKWEKFAADDPTRHFPPPAEGHGMAYDLARERLAFFDNASNNQDVYTWERDEATHWHEMNDLDEEPELCRQCTNNGYSAAYAPSLGTIVVFIWRGNETWHYGAP